MRQTTTAEVRLDAGKAARFNVSAQSTGGFDRLLSHTERGLPLPKTPKGTILASQRPGIWGMSAKVAVRSAIPLMSQRARPRPLVLGVPHARKDGPVMRGFVGQKA